MHFCSGWVSNLPALKMILHFSSKFALMCLLVSSSSVSDSFCVIPPLIEAGKGDLALGPNCISAVIWCCGMEHHRFWNGWMMVRSMVTGLTIGMVLRVLTDTWQCLVFDFSWTVGLGMA